MDDVLYFEEGDMGFFLNPLILYGTFSVDKH